MLMILVTLTFLEKTKKKAEKKKTIDNSEERKKNIDEVENDVVSNEKFKLKRKRGRKSMKETKERETQNNAINKFHRQTDCIDWKNGVHAKFLKVVQQLGEGSKLTSILFNFITIYLYRMI